MSTNLRKIAVLCTASASAVEEDQLMKRKLARAQLLWRIIVVTSLGSTSDICGPLCHGSWC